MQAAADNTLTVLVTDAARGSGLAFIRSLGRKGYRVIAADCDPWSPGLRSRFACRRILYPSPSESPLDCVNTILQAVEQHRVDLLVPVTDELVLPLSESRNRFPDFCRLAIPEPHALQATTDKHQTLELAQQVGVPTPETSVARTAEEALRAAETWNRWPLVLKPAASRLLRTLSTVQKPAAGVERLTVCYADSPRRLAEQMRRFEGRCPVLLQHYVAGTGLGVELLMRDGRPLAAFQHRRLREVPVTGGASSFRESVPLDPVLYDYALRLLAPLRWTGLAMVEFKAGEAGPLLMEINGRIWGSLPLAVQSGVDFPRLLAELYLPSAATPASRRREPQPRMDIRGNSSAAEASGSPCPSRRPAYRVGVRARNLELDLAWVFTVMTQSRRHPFLPLPRRREAAAALLGLLNPRSKFDIVSLRDPLPGLVLVPRLLRKFVRKLIDGRLRGKSRGRAGETDKAEPNRNVASCLARIMRI